MKSVEKKTPPAPRSVDRNSASGKKLIQARLPFKVISSTATTTPGSGQTPSPALKSVVGKEVAAAQKQNELTPNGLVTKKRKLSYSDEPSEERGPKKVACALDGEAKENEVVVVLDDDEVEGATRGKDNGMVVVQSSDEGLEPFVRLENIDAMISRLKNDKTGRIVLTSPKTPMNRSKSAAKDNNVSTPPTSSKFQIKLPISTHKKKRKQLLKDEQCDGSGSDLEIVESHAEKKRKANDGSELRKFFSPTSSNKQNEIAKSSPAPEIGIVEQVVYVKETTTSQKTNVAKDPSPKKPLSVDKNAKNKSKTKVNADDSVCISSDEDDEKLAADQDDRKVEEKSTEKQSTNPDDTIEVLDDSSNQSSDKKSTGDEPKESVSTVISEGKDEKKNGKEKKATESQENEGKKDGGEKELSKNKSPKKSSSIDKKTPAKQTPKGKKNEPIEQKNILDFAKGMTPKRSESSAETKQNIGDPVCISSSDEEEHEQTKSSQEDKQSPVKSDSGENKDSDPIHSLKSDEILDESTNQSATSTRDKYVTKGEPKEDSSTALNTSTTSVNTPRQRKSVSNTSSDKKLTREERERKLQEEKLQKQREKDEKERQKRREREEKEEQRRKEKEEKEEQRRKEKEEKEDQRRKEKEEKEEQRRKEKEEKEKKRLAELEVKNEERRKKEEAKEEERRKKEEDRRKKELEKEEEENKKKKAAQAFTKFFIAKPVSKTDERLSVDSDVQPAQTNFMPFRIKDHMKLAPLFRKRLSRENKSALDAVLGSDACAPKESLYLNSLKTGKITAGKDTRTLGIEDDNSEDVIVVEDELKDAGLEIDDEKQTVQTIRAKYFLFHENVRPPYRGTWRKKSSVVGPRKPFATDKTVFDYEVDSDDEWEEEEPGESLEDDSEEEPEDDYEVDNEFFVPHGHLSDEELQDEDEQDEDNTPEAQKAKLKIMQQEFAQEMTKKQGKIKPRLVGVVWTDVNGNQPESCPSIVWDSLMKRAMIFAEPIVLTEPEPSVSETATTTTTQKVKLTDELVRELIRLVHHNRHSKKFLVHEFQAYLKQKYGNDETFPKYSKTTIQKKIEKLAKWEISDDETRKKKKKLCWIVNLDSLKRYTMDDIDLQNDWKYVLPPKEQLTGAPKKNDEQQSPTAPTDEPAENSNDGKPKTPAVITKFTKVLSELEKAKQFESVTTTPSSDKKAKNESNSSRVPTTPTVDLTKDTTPAAVPKSATPKSTKTATPASGKKRVALLMSVPCGQAVNEQKKNDLISKFLKKDNKGSASHESKSAADSDKHSTTNAPIIIDSSPEKPKSKQPTEAKKTTPSSQQRDTKPKKRVPLLMSVGRGQTIPEEKKKDVISKFLEKSDKTDVCKKEDANKNLQIVSSDQVTPMDVDV